jgi:hypothetical protein
MNGTIFYEKLAILWIPPNVIITIIAAMRLAVTHCCIPNNFQLKE